MPTESANSFLFAADLMILQVESPNTLAAKVPVRLQLSEEDLVARTRIHSLIRGLYDEPPNLEELIADCDWERLLASYKWEELTASFDRLGEIPGLKILERRILKNDFCGDSRYQCAEYAFGNRAMEFRGKFKDTITVLESCGCSISSTPSVNGLIAYGYIESGTFSAKHFGKVNGTRVSSKFGFGHIIEHPTNLVFPYWGNDIIYLTLPNPLERF